MGCQPLGFLYERIKPCVFMAVIFKVRFPDNSNTITWQLVKNLDSTLGPFHHFLSSYSTVSFHAIQHDVKSCLHSFNVFAYPPLLQTVALMNEGSNHACCITQSAWHTAGELNKYRFSEWMNVEYV